MQVQGGGAPVGGAIGYNAAKINALMDAISDAYTALEAKYVKNYENLKPILRKEWVGEDELDFESKLVARLNDSYYNAGLLSQAAINAVYNVAESWKNFQKKNVFGAEGTEITVNATFKEVTITPKESAITFASKEYGDDVNRGLQNGAGSYNTILDALEAFRTQAVTDSQNFTSEFDINSAFFGGSEKGVETFMSNFENSLAAIITAVKDFVDGLNSLANTNYSTASSVVNEYATTTAKTEIDKLTTESTKNTRWTTE